MTTLYTTIDSPIGRLLLAGEGTRLSRLDMQEGRRPIRIRDTWERQDGAFGEVTQQLEHYFAGERRSFELELEMAGTPFELRVWQALREIPYGKTTSYGELAREIGEPGAARAVGVANARNPVAVIVPCHRVIGANGDLTGFGGGLERKRFLLDLESGVLPLV